MCEDLFSDSYAKPLGTNNQFNEQCSQFIAIAKDQFRIINFKRLFFEKIGHKTFGFGNQHGEVFRTYCEEYWVTYDGRNLKVSFSLPYPEHGSSPNDELFV